MDMILHSKGVDFIKTKGQKMQNGREEFVLVQKWIWMSIGSLILMFIGLFSAAIGYYVNKISNHDVVLGVHDARIQQNRDGILEIKDTQRENSRKLDEILRELKIK